MAQSQVLLHALASVLLTGPVQQEQGHIPTLLGMASCSGDTEILVGAAEVHICRRKGVGHTCRGAHLQQEKHGAHLHQTPWKCPVRLGNRAWLLPSEATKGLWAGGSTTPPIFTDGQIENQGSEIT